MKAIRERLVFDPSFWRECTPSYLNYEGEEINKYTVWGEPFGGGYYAFDELLKVWHEKGDMPGMLLGT